jgi:hypothetical protein
MDAKANSAEHAVIAEPLFPRPWRSSSLRCVPLTLLVAFGVFAFIFSAISPDDDDIQQEFCKTSESRQCTFINSKAVSNLRIFQIRAIHSALAPSAPQSPSQFVIARVSLPGDEIKDRVCSSRSGDRSPPTRILL